MAHQIELYRASIERLHQAIEDLAEIIDFNSNNTVQEDIACAHDIAVSMLLSNISLYNISTKQMSFELKYGVCNFYCFKTAMILCRESFEKFLLFSSIYSDSGKINEYEYLIWRICSYSHAKKLRNISDESIENYNRANFDLDVLVEKLKTTDDFLSKTEREQGKLLTDIQNGKNNFKDIKTKLTTLKLPKMYNIYRYLCDHSHSGFLSVSKTITSTDIKDQKQNLKFSADMGIWFIYMFIKKYCSFFALNTVCGSKSYDDISSRADLHSAIAKEVCNRFADR